MRGCGIVNYNYRISKSVRVGRAINFELSPSQEQGH